MLIIRGGINSKKRELCPTALALSAFYYNKNKHADTYIMYLHAYSTRSLGFSLLNACLRVSQQRNEVRMKQKPTCYAGGVKSLYRKTPFRYNRVVQSLLQERKGVLWRISLMISPIQNGCVNTILYLLLSIDENYL